VQWFALSVLACPAPDKVIILSAVFQHACRTILPWQTVDPIHNVSIPCAPDHDRSSFAILTSILDFGRPEAFSQHRFFGGGRLLHSTQLTETCAIGGKSEPAVTTGRSRFRSRRVGDALAIPARHCTSASSTERGVCCEHAILRSSFRGATNHGALDQQRRNRCSPTSHSSDRDRAYKFFRHSTRSRAVYGDVDAISRRHCSCIDFDWLDPCICC